MIMLFQWLGLKRHRRVTARLNAIYVTKAAGQPMVEVSSVQAIRDHGLQGDRYYNGTGFWKATDSCQVTLISMHDLRNVKRRSQLDLNNGSHRRNLVIDGIKTKVLEGQVFRIGDALFRYQKPRPPCGYLDKIEGRGMAHALGRHSGVCLQVVRSGMLCIGDTVEFIQDDNY